jgi:hypothetical protein
VIAIPKKKRQEGHAKDPPTDDGSNDGLLRGLLPYERPAGPKEVSDDAHWNAKE